MKPYIKIKRIYEEAAEDDGIRILTDRLWPRGISKAVAAIDEWAKELAPSAELRKWFDHDPALWAAFQKKYIAELKAGQAVNTFIQSHNATPVITLLYAAKDEAHVHTIVLQHYLQKEFEKHAISNR